MLSAAELLRKKWKDIHFSSVWKTKALVHEDQDEFLNAVAIIETSLNAEGIYKKLLDIEKRLKKAPLFHFGPRTIDLDLLLYGQHIIKTAELTIPHTSMHERRFVLEPLCEIVNPNMNHPILNQTWKSFLKNTQDQPCTKTDISL